MRTLPSFSSVSQMPSGEFGAGTVEVAGAASCEEGIDHGALTGAVALGAGNSAPLIRRRALLASCLCEISSKHAVTVPLGSLAGTVGGYVLAVGAEGVAVAA